MNSSKQPIYPGALSSIGNGKRVGIPKRVYPAATAWHALKGSVEVMAELREGGHIRVHLMVDVEEHLAAIEADLEGRDDPEAREQRAALDLRFHRITYYPAGRRFRLSDEVLAVLDVGAGTENRCYVQVVDRAIDILSVKRLVGLQTPARSASTSDR